MLVFFLFNGCSDSYKDEDLVGTWKIIEVKSEENEVPTAFLGAETIVLQEKGKYVFPGLVNELGDWNVLGDKLRLHKASVKDLTGNVVYEGHDSEWRVGVNKEFMIWRGTRRFYNQDLRVLFEKTE